MKKSRIVFIVILGSILSITIRSIITESQAKNAAAAFGLEYVREHYDRQEPLKVTGKCHPFWESGMHRVAIEDSNGAPYYFYIMLGRKHTLTRIEDFTQPVRSGETRFRCGR